MRTVFAVILLFAAWAPANSAEPWPTVERRLPPPGIEIPEETRTSLERELEDVQGQFDTLSDSLSKEAAPLAVDIEIYLKAVRFALEENEFFRDADVEAAHGLLSAARQRIAQLSAGDAPWTDDKGLVVRGYRSAVDDSVQPYGLVIPDQLDLSRPTPLYVWLHGRNDRLADLQFIADRSAKTGQITPPDAIVLHPFGRSCLGWKSTAEIDVLEAVDSVCQRYSIDRDRIVLMGFSMGGAGAWHIGAHYADRFAAVHAGAGFVDVARYQKLSPDAFPPAYEQTMWDVYDVPKYVRNLFNLPVVAYSGEVDKQKDAADFMGEAFQAEGRELVHLIGPGMGHKYHPEVLPQVMQRMHQAVDQGRDTQRDAVSLQTRTLRYNRLHWVEALGLEAHWQDSRLDARYADGDRLEVTTRNIQSLRLQPPRPFAALAIDGQEVSSAGSAEPPLLYEKRDGRWLPLAESSDRPPRKSPGLQGPIDDVLLEPFLVVLPTGSSSPQLDRWVAFELDHFRRRWKNVYRGSLREVRDVDLTPQDIERYHLICWGDAGSNAVLRKVARELPLTWRDGRIELGDRSFDAADHALLEIAPNPLNPRKYLVTNSGPTHREAHDRTNSLQNPKLGDWAVVRITSAPDAERPGRIEAAGTFDDSWQLAEDAAGHAATRE